MALKPGVVYKVESPTSRVFYIGRTTTDLQEAIRINLSKFEAYKRDTSIDYYSLFDVLANNTYNISVLEAIVSLTTPISTSN